YPGRGGGSRRPAGESDPGNGPLVPGRNRAGVLGSPVGGSPLWENFHRLFGRRGHRGGGVSYAPNGGRIFRGECLRRYPHPGAAAADAAGGCEPHRYKRGRGHHEGSDGYRGGRYVMERRAVLIVLDGGGIGALPDAHLFGDEGCNTLGNVARQVGLNLPHLQRLGLGNIAPLEGIDPVAAPLAAYGKMAERSPGKDTTTGHWEMAGIILTKPFPVYPNGFPPEI